MRRLGGVEERGLDVFARQLWVLLEQGLHTQFGQAGDQHGDSDPRAADARLTVVNLWVTDEAVSPVLRGQGGRSNDAGFYRPKAAALKNWANTPVPRLPWPLR